MSSSITHSEVHRFIEEAIGTDTHAKRVLSLSNATLGTLHAASLSVRAIGLALSQARAAAVRAYLVEKHGIDGARLQTKGLGEGKPIDTNDTPEGKANNRRVELVRL